jgi:hypothetical protein
LFSCKKENSTLNNSPNNTTDTTKTTNDVSISDIDYAGVKTLGTLQKTQLPQMLLLQLITQVVMLKLMLCKQLILLELQG